MKRWPREAPYVLGNLRRASDALASGSGNVKKRLGNAFISHLFVIGDPDFPDNLVGDWQWIMDRLTAAGPDEQGHDSVNRTLSPMTDEEAAEIVQRILALERKYRSAVQSLNS